jgi:hypothetical protein
MSRPSRELAEFYKITIMRMSCCARICALAHLAVPAPEGGIYD